MAKAKGVSLAQLVQAPSKEQRDLAKLSKMSYMDFLAAVGCDVLGPEKIGQRVVAKVVYDKIPIKKLTKEEREVAHEVFGDEVGEIPPLAYNVVALVCGRRGGKSYVLAALRLLWGALRRDLSAVVAGNIPTALVMGPRLDSGLETFSYIEGAIDSTPALAAAVRQRSAGMVILERADGKLVKLEVLPATRGGAAIRGRWYTDAIFDEVAQFRDETNGVINDKDLFDAVSAAIMPGGQIILASTPFAETGLFFQLFRENWGRPSTALVAHASTLTLYNSQQNQVIVQRGMELDEINARREYQAIFASAGTEQFFSAAEIDAVTFDYSMGELPKPGTQVVAAADLGFRRDSSVLVVVHIDPATAVRRVVEIVEMIPQPGAPLRPTDVILTFLAVLKKHGVQWLIGDIHYKDTIIEYLAEAKVGYVDAPKQPAEAYVRARALIREGLVRLPKNQRLSGQLRDTEGRINPGGALSISHPRWKKGGHGDIVSALVLALWASAGETIPMPVAEVGSKAWIEEQTEARREAVRKRHAKQEKWWERPDLFRKKKVG